MLKIYHNPKCSKSREGCQILKDSKQEYEIVEYLKNPLTEDEIKDLVRILKINPIDLVRKKEDIWKENYAVKEMSDQEIITALSQHPKLIERPIVVKEDKAVIGRPPSLIKGLF